MRHSENERRALIPKENQQTFQLKQQSVISQAIYINLKTIADGNAKIAKYLLSDNNSEQKQSPDEHLMSLLRNIVEGKENVQAEMEMVEREENVQAESVEVDFFTRLADTCFRLSRLYIDSSEGGDVERLFDYLPQVFYDPAVPLDDEDEQKQLYEITDDYYSFFKFCMSFMTSYFFENVSSQVVEQVKTNLKKLLEDLVFCDGLIQAIEQDAKKGEPVEGWLEYLYPLKNNDSIISSALFYLRGCRYAPTPPRTLDCVPAQSKEIDVQQTMLVTIADVLELMNNFLCRKLKPFRSFCGLNYDFNQGEKKDIEKYYSFLKWGALNADIRTAISEDNPLPLIKWIWRFEGLIKEFDFLKRHEAFKDLFHSEWRKQEAKLEKARVIIDKECQEICHQNKEILSNILDSLKKDDVAFEVPEEQKCSITFEIMLTPVYYSPPSQKSEGEAQENKGEVQESEGEGQESKGEGRMEEFGRRYVYKKTSIEKALKGEGERMHPHLRIPVEISDFVEDKALRDDVAMLIIKTWKEHKQEQASLARSAVSRR